MTIELILDAEVAEAGGIVTGRVSWRDVETVPRDVYIELLYRTEGRGDTDRAVVDQVKLPGDTSGAHGFRLRVPDSGPISYDGRYIRVIWEVQLRFDVKLRRDPKHQARLGVLPKGGIVLWQRHTDPSAVGLSQPPPPTGAPTFADDASPFEPPTPDFEPPPSGEQR